MRQIIDSSAAGNRWDRFLRKRLPGSSLSEIYRLIRTGIARVNGRKQKETYRLQSGDEVEFPDPLTETQRHFFHGELQIAYEDDDYLVVVKPAGLKTIPDSKTEISLTGIVQTYLKDKLTETFSPSPVSRLDRNTMGLVLFGKNYSALRKLNELMRSRSIKKYYLALVFGTMKEALEIVLNVTKNPQENKSLVDEQGIETRTIVKPLFRFSDRTLLEVELMTGKSHQIRLALSHSGHPIVGDAKYGMSGRGQLLCAYRLVFDGLEVSCIPEEFRQALKKEGFHDHVPRSRTSARSISV